MSTPFDGGAFDVICVGAATLDTIGVVEHVPAADERVVSAPFVTAGGGPAATAAVALARLGARVAFCGVVGDDDAGRAVRAQFEAEGVDTRWLLTRPGASTSRSVVLVELGTGARSIVATPSPMIDADAVPVGASDWLHVDQHGYAPAAAALARSSADADARPRLSVDAGNPIDGLDLRAVDLYVPTTASLTARFGTASDEAGIEGALAAASAAGAAQVVATAGSGGSYVFADGAATRVPGHAVDVVSTLGAGDVFHGAVLAGLVDGMPLTAAAGFACVVAALSCRGLDGRSSIPTHGEAHGVFARKLAEQPAQPTGRAYA